MEGLALRVWLIPCSACGSTFVNAIYSRCIHLCRRQAKQTRAMTKTQSRSRLLSLADFSASRIDRDVLLARRFQPVQHSDGICAPSSVGTTRSKSQPNDRAAHTRAVVMSSARPRVLYSRSVPSCQVVVRFVVADAAATVDFATTLRYYGV